MFKNGFINEFESPLINICHKSQLFIGNFSIQNNLPGPTKYDYSILISLNSYVSFFNSNLTLLKITGFNSII